MLIHREFNLTVDLKPSRKESDLVDIRSIVRYAEFTDELEKKIFESHMTIDYYRWTGEAFAPYHVSCSKGLNRYDIHVSPSARIWKKHESTLQQLYFRYCKKNHIWYPKAHVWDLNYISCNNIKFASEQEVIQHMWEIIDADLQEAEAINV